MNACVRASACEKSAPLPQSRAPLFHTHIIKSPKSREIGARRAYPFSDSTTYPSSHAIGRFVRCILPGSRAETFALEFTPTVSYSALFVIPRISRLTNRRCVQIKLVAQHCIIYRLTSCFDDCFEGLGIYYEKKVTLYVKNVLVHH